MTRVVSKDRARELIDGAASVIPVESSPNDTPLSPQERNICEQLVIKGYHYFSEIGWPRSEEMRFLARPNVRDEIDRLSNIMSEGEELLSRQTFLARVKLGQFIPGALTIVQRVLRGTLPDENGRSPNPETLPTAEQYAAAMDVLNMCGISSGGKGNVTTNNTLNIAVFDRRATSTDESFAPDDPNSVLSRESVRNVIDRIMGAINNTDKQIKQLEEHREVSVARKAKKKKIRRRD